jgi:hypothetical protein
MELPFDGNPKSIWPQGSQVRPKRGGNEVKESNTVPGIRPRGERQPGTDMKAMLATNQSNLLMSISENSETRQISVERPECRSKRLEACRTKSISQSDNLSQERG